MSNGNGELAALEERIAANEPPEAEPVRELRTLVGELATSHHPQSLAELRKLVDQCELSPERRSLLQYVLMDMLDRRELEIGGDRRLIVNLAA